MCQVDLPGLCRVMLSALCCLLQEVSATRPINSVCSLLIVAGSFSLLCLFVAGRFSYQAYHFCLLCVVCCRKFQLPGLSVLSALCCLLQEVSATRPISSVCSVLFVAGSFSYQAYQFCLFCVVCCRKFQLPGLSVLSVLCCLLEEVSASRPISSVCSV